jgi:hypothetical protein
MYNFITNKNFNELLKQYPIVNETPTIAVINDLRRKLGCGVYQAKLLMQRSNSVQEAINLNHSIVMKINKHN